MASPSSTTAIRSARSCPFLFDGVLPDFNIGTDNGTTCAPRIRSRPSPISCRRPRATRSILNGRFRGGWTTRHYGRPEEGVHAIQMELAQSTHLESETPPFAYDEGRAAKLRVHLGNDFGTPRNDRPFPESRKPTMTNPRHNIREIRAPRGPRTQRASPG